jgi:NTP pyrophosphatase (non-canonical NTP hydrolase)
LGVLGSDFGSGYCIPLIDIEVIMEKILEEIRQERARQKEKWGVQSHDLMTWNTILMEEVGEFSQAALHEKFGGPTADCIEEELIQIAAIAVAILECKRNGKA